MKKLLCLLLIGLLLVACSRAPSAPPKAALPDSLIDLDLAVSHHVNSPISDSSGYTFLPKDHSYFKAQGGHYFSTTFEVLNRACPTCDANSATPTSLSLIAVAGPDTVAQSPFSEFKANQDLSAAQPSELARRFKPTHGMTASGVVGSRASFQAFTTGELGASTTAMPSDSSPLPYGFRVAPGASSEADSLGFVTVALKLPDTAAINEEDLSFRMRFFLSETSGFMVTESLEEQADGTAAARAETLSARLRVLGDSPAQADSRLCSLPLTADSSPVYLVHDESCIPTETVDSLSDEQDGLLGKGQLSLREALGVADAGGKLTVSAALLEQGLVLDADLGPLQINRDITLDAGSTRFIIDGEDATALFDVTEDVTATFNNIGFHDGSSSGVGGALTIAEGASVTVMNSHFHLNYAAGDGGAIYNLGSLSVHDSLFETNTSSSDGGALANFGMLTLERTRFGGNVARGAGGAVFTASAMHSDIDTSLFSHNEADYGGALYHQFGDLDMAYSTLYANRAIRDGGGLYVIAEDSHLTLSANLIAMNLDAAQNLWQDVYVKGGLNPFNAQYNLIGLGDDEGHFASQKTNIVGLSLSSYIDPQLTGDAANIKARLYPGDSSPSKDVIVTGVLNCGASLVDLSGHSRPVGAMCDLGAFEAP